MINFGAKGSGKTMHLQVHMAEAMLRRELCVWRGRSVDTWHTFASFTRVKVLMPDYEAYSWKTVPLREHRKGRTIDPEEDLGLDLERFHSLHEAVSLLERDRVNVILTLFPDQLEETAWWVKFWHYMTHRENRDWVRIAMDEFDDVMPEYPPYEEFLMHARGKDELKDFRKTFINLEASTHTYQDIDHRIFNKFRWWVYLPGSQKIPGGKSQVHQGYINKLQLGQGIIESTRFQRFDFDPIPPRFNPDFQVQVELERAPVNVQVPGAVPVPKPVPAPPPPTRTWPAGQEGA